MSNLNQQQITSSIKIYIANTNQYIDYKNVIIINVKLVKVIKLYFYCD